MSDIIFCAECEEPMERKDSHYDPEIDARICKYCVHEQGLAE